MGIGRWVLMSTLLILAAGCKDRASNFSQYPGFAEWYATNPPASTLPTAEEAALLERYRPRLFLPDGHEGPIDFYRDYIAQGVLQDGAGEVVPGPIDRRLLNARKADPTMTFTHRPNGDAPAPKIYGRIDQEPVDWPGCETPLPLTFLTYHLVFRSSGLPAGLPAWHAWPLSLIADLDDWHQLDHYTAVTLTLAPIEPDARRLEPKTLRPIAATFQQHNYQRTYVLDETEGPGHLMLPADNRLAVDIAIRSNELYPHQPDRLLRRAVSFMDRKSAAYMVADGPAPWLAADDVTDPAGEIDPPLTFLPPDDAFYTFQGWLGERRRLPGRDGPPGADYNTLPPMKPLLNQVALSWWHEGYLDWLESYETLFQDGFPASIDPLPFLQPLANAVDITC